MALKSLNQLKGIQVEVDLSIPKKQRPVILWTLFLVGIISLFTIHIQKKELKLARLILVTTSALCGTKLLRDYRTPSRLEQEANRVDSMQAYLEERERALQAEVEAKIKSLESQKESTIKALQSEEVGRRAKLEKELAVLREQIEKESAAHRQRLFEEKDRHDQQLYLERQKFDLEYQRSCDELKYREKEIHEVLNKEREEAIKFQQQLESQLQAAADVQTQQYNQALESLQLRYEEQIRNLTDQLAVAKAPKLPRGIRHIDEVARQVISVLYEYGCPVDFEEGDSVPGREHIWVCLRPEIDESTFKKAVKQLPHRLRGVYGEPELVFSDGYCEIILNVDKESQKSIPGVDGVGKDKNEIVPPPPNWFEKAIKESFHYFVSGSTGSGKSVLIDNLGALALQILQEKPEEEVEIIIIDPKFGSESDWQINGKEILPQYQNYNPAIQHDSFWGAAQEGIIKMGLAARERLELGAQAKRNKQKAPIKNPQLWIFDEAADLMSRTAAEWEFVYDEAGIEELPGGCTSGEDLKRLLASSTKSALRLGRSEKVKVVIIGQSDLVSTYQLNKPDLLNCTQFFLRNNAIRGVNEVASTPEEKKFLRKQIALYQQRAMQDSKYKYFALVKLPTEPAFVAILPPPHSYSHGSIFPVQNMVQTMVQNPALSSVLEGAKGATPHQSAPDIYDLVQQAKAGLLNGSGVSAPTEVQSSAPTGSAENSKENSLPKIGAEGAPDITQQEYQALIYYLQNGMNQQTTIEKIWGLKKGGNALYKGRAFQYNQVKELIEKHKRQ